MDSESISGAHGTGTFTVCGKVEIRSHSMSTMPGPNMMCRRTNVDEQLEGVASVHIELGLLGELVAVVELMPLGQSVELQLCPWWWEQGIA